VGEPAEVTLNVPAAPAVKVVLLALVICGATCAWAKAAKPVVNSTTKKLRMHPSAHGNDSGINLFPYMIATLDGADLCIRTL
jgi:hypothetical protein